MRKTFSRFLPVLLLAYVVGTCPAETVFTPTNLGSITVNSTSWGHSLSFSLGMFLLTQNPTFALRYGNEFALGSATCDVSKNCTVPITFTPLHPGIRSDGVLVKDASNAVIAWMQVSGIGLGPIALLEPVMETQTNASLLSGAPAGLAIDASGEMYVSDAILNVVYKIPVGGGAATIIAGQLGSPGYSGDGGPAISGALDSPRGLAIDAVGNLYIADHSNQAIRKVDVFTGIISTVAGHQANGPSDTLVGVNGLTFDSTGNLLIGEDGAVTKLTPLGVTSLVAGSANGMLGDSGDGGPATAATLGLIEGLAFDSNGSLYMADEYNSVIWKVDPVNGNINRMAGNATPGDSGDGAAALSAQLSYPGALAVDAAGNIYVAEPNVENVRRIDNSGSNTITTLFTGTPSLLGLALASNGQVYAIDSARNSIVTLSGSGLNFPTTIAGQSSASQSATLHNNGTANLNITSITLANGLASDFTESNNCGVSLAPGASCIITVTFVPRNATGAPLRTDTLVITDNDATSTQQQMLSGVATPLWAGQPNFENQTVGTTSSVQPIYLANTSGGSIALGAVTLASFTDFAISGNTCGNSLSAFEVCVISMTFTPQASDQRATVLNITYTAAGASGPTTLSIPIVATGLAASGLTFIPLTPCRVADTRYAAGAFGGPTMAANTTRDFVIPNSSCGVPQTASAYSLNVTAVPHGALSYLTIWPTAQSQPLVSTLNSDGRVKANAAIVPAGANGAVSVYVTNSADVVLDINGYFAAPASAPALAFYPLTPCRLVDTRSLTGALGGPLLAGGQSRTFPIQAGGCNVPTNAQAYSLNFTAVPRGPISYITTWPTGQSQPLVSTLNAPTGEVTANAAIVPAGTNGSIDVYSTNDSDLVIDINGYFGPVGTGGLSLYSVPPCRVLDTRFYILNPPTAMLVNGTLEVSATNSSCATPTVAQAFVFNATVVPSGGLGYLSLWPAGTAQPLVSTLNALDGAVTSNMAIVPAINGSVNIFSTSPTYVILDVSSYFAP